MLASKRKGKQTVAFANPPVILGAASVVGKLEGEGPLKNSFDMIHEDSTLGEKSWEKAESRMQKEAFEKASVKASIPLSGTEVIFAGDLLNQCIGTSFGLRESNVPFYGLYGACSTMAESLSIAASYIDGGFASSAAAMASSHFCSAERQYRTPLEYGAQRPPTAQWTVTGAGAVILGNSGTGPKITYATAGKIVDPGVKDSMHMGAAMAPAAFDTISAFFNDTGMKSDDFSLIVTGDLGLYGLEIARELFRRAGIGMGANFSDCGIMIFDLEKQKDVMAGGSGCGCSAVTLCGHILNEMNNGNLNRVLFCGTGALFSPVSTAQGESIPSVCHAVVIEK